MAASGGVRTLLSLSNLPQDGETLAPCFGASRYAVRRIGGVRLSKFIESAFATLT